RHHRDEARCSRANKRVTARSRPVSRCQISHQTNKSPLSESGLLGSLRDADIHVRIDGRDRPRKAMKMAASGLLSTGWRNGQMSFDFGEVETACKFDLGA